MFDENSFTLHEVYYDDDGNVKYWSTDPIAAYGETLEELKSDLEHQLKALEKPVLEETEDDSQRKTLREVT